MPGITKLSPSDQMCSDKDAAAYLCVSRVIVRRLIDEFGACVRSEPPGPAGRLTRPYAKETQWPS